jgi:formylglycine-generating enzyme required for sulfatase activity
MTASMSLRGRRAPRRGNRCTSLALLLVFILLASCAPVDLDSPLPYYETGVPRWESEWVEIPAGEFLQGQSAEPAAIDYDYEIMVNDVNVAQYLQFLSKSIFMDGELEISGDQIVGFYPGDEFHGVKHEEKIAAGNYIVAPLDDPASRFTYDMEVGFRSKTGYEDHPMTNVSWFGAWSYCTAYGWRLPTELEWEKAARGPATGENPDRPFPWGDEILRANANFYSSRDPFEDMSSFGSRTTPVGFYNGQKYGDYQTLDSASPYGLYDMAGNVWQWTGDVYEGMHYRFLRGGSKDTYDMDLRLWVRNSATPTYFSPAVGFRCAR